MMQRAKERERKKREKERERDMERTLTYNLLELRIKRSTWRLTFYQVNHMTLTSFECNKSLYNQYSHQIAKNIHQSIQRRKSVSLYSFGGTDIGKIGESASAEGAKLRWPKARSPFRLGTGGNLWGLGGRSPPKNLRWGTAHATVTPNILRSSVCGMRAQARTE